MADQRIEKIADHYGFEEEERQCMEECGELIHALSRWMRKCSDRDPNEALAGTPEYMNLVEELADVKVVIKQIEYLERCAKQVDRAMDAKIERQLRRMEHDE